MSFLPSRLGGVVPLLLVPCALALVMCGSDDEGAATTDPAADGGGTGDGGGGSSSGDPGPRDGSAGDDAQAGPKTATFAFARAFPGNVQGNAEYGEPPVAALPGGGYVLAFLFRGTFTVGPTTLVSTGPYRDLAVVWVDASGAPVRGKLVDADDDIDPIGLGVDADGNVYLAATSFSATVNLGDAKTVTGNDVSQYGLLAKYDANGVAQWGRSFQSNGGLGNFSVMARGASVAVLGYSTLSGGIRYTTAHGSPTSPTFVGNNPKAFVAGIDAATGDVAWFEQLAGAGGGKAWEGAILSTGDVLVAGEFEGGDLQTDDPLVLGPRTGTHSEPNAFVTRFSGTGAHVWTRTWGATTGTTTIAAALAVGDGDKIAVAGPMGSPVDFGKGARTGTSFVATLDGANGATLWDKALPSGRPASVAFTAAGGLVLATDNAAAAPGTVDGVALPATLGGQLVAFDVAGLAVWAKAPALASAQTRTRAGRLAVQGTTVAEHGTFTGSVDFGGGALVSNGDAGSQPATYLYGFTP